MSGVHEFFNPWYNPFRANSWVRVRVRFSNKVKILFVNSVHGITTSKFNFSELKIGK